MAPPTKERAMKGRIAWLSAALLLPLGTVAAPKDPDVRIDPRADEAMHRMSNYLTELKSFRFRGSTVADMVTNEGEKIQFVIEQKVAIKRPNHFRSERQGPLVDATVRYDGKSLSVYGKRSGYYAIVPAPPRMTEAIDTIRDRYGIEAPAADLYVDDAYDQMMEDVTVGRYVGLETVDGAPCHHLAFRGKEVDWQIWIDAGPQPLPRRYAITSKHEAAEPEFGITLSQWEPNARLSDSDFTFRPPPGAKQIELRPLGPARSARRGGAR
jgi:hypothetical protein